MPRQPLTRGQQRPRKRRRRHVETSWTALGMIAGAVLIGMFWGHYLLDFVFGGNMKLVIVAMALLIAYQNRDRLMRWYGVVRAKFQR